MQASDWLQQCHLYTFLSVLRPKPADLRKQPYLLIYFEYLLYSLLVTSLTLYWLRLTSFPLIVSFTISLALSSSSPSTFRENILLILDMLNTTTAEFAKNIDADEMVHNGPSHLDLQCLPSSL